MVSKASLKNALVDRCQIISRLKWADFEQNFSDVQSLIDFLQATPRFQLHKISIPMLTPDVLQAIESGDVESLLFTAGDREFVRLVQIQQRGQGVVWIACPVDVQASPDDLVVIKSPKSANASSYKKHLAGIQREIDILSRLSGGTIVKLIAANPDTGTLVTKFVDGETLREKLAVDKRIGIAQVVKVGIDICLALEKLHAENWIHKDIKPDNVMLDRNERGVLIDFGMSVDPKKIHSLSGTPYFIAPEIFFRDADVDCRADIFSLSATLYQLLTGFEPRFQHCLHPGKPSLTAELDVEEFRLGDASADCDPSDIRAETPRTLSRLIVQGLSSQVDRRPSDVREYKNALVKILKTFSKVREIEKGHWSLVKILIQIYRNINYDADYLNNERQNVTEILRNLKAIQRLDVLNELNSKLEQWVDYDLILSLAQKTSKIIGKLNSLIDQLESLLGDSHRRDQMMRILVVRSLVEIRTMVVKSLEAAHEWKSVLTLYGVDQFEDKQLEEFMKKNVSTNTFCSDSE